MIAPGDPRQVDNFDNLASIVKDMAFGEQKFIQASLGQGGIPTDTTGIQLALFGKGYDVMIAQPNQKENPNYLQLTKTGPI